ncbi:MAG: LD-carboxypeptidase [Longimonas sp.]|uniref:S66 peptidase family protein n=1 Tax=Longimonas sp. TaxID=2039626 RepID=UPI0033640C30
MPALPVPMPPLRPGARVRVVAPASAPRTPGTYIAGMHALQRDWNVDRAYVPGPPHGYLSMPDAPRAAALMDALCTSGIDAVLCARGGYGSLRLLSRLDWDALRSATPRWVVGYSDITALQLACWHRLGWPSISGPVLTEWHQLSPAMRHEIFQVSAPRPYTLTWSDMRSDSDPSPETLSPGTATGLLLGGTLSILTRLLGTSFMPDLRGAVLLLEDVQEPPYAVDRMLMHLELAGVLDALAGVVLGRFSTPETVTPPTLSMRDVFTDYFGGRPYPVLSHVPYGHLLPRHSFPMGVPVRLHLTNTTQTLTCYPDARR